MDCYDVQLLWGTGDILKDFGFVENYPHRYVYVDEDIWFEVEKNDDTDELLLKWDTSGEYERITEDGIEYLEEEFDRIKDVGKSVLVHNTEGVPDHEWRIIQAYYDTLVTDLSFAIGAAKKLVKDDHEL